MRALAMLLLLAVLAAGCTNAPSASAPDGRPGEADGIQETDPAEGGESPLVAEMPQHPVGRAWTFEGEELYNDDPRFTVVVARADASGYLFAGGAEDDLVYAALWGSPWFGERLPTLVGSEWLNILEFPIIDGKSWQLSETVRVVATEADVATPGGIARGFRIEGASDSWRASYDYAPSLGQITRWETGRPDGTSFENLRMTAVADAQPWVWYELGELVVVPNPHEPQAFDVSEGFDHVIASAGGVRGGRAAVAPPSGEPWTAEFPGDEDWRHAMLDATPGRWEAAVAGWPFVEDAPPIERPSGWAYMHVAPVRWVHGAP